MTVRVTFLVNGLGLGNSTRCHAIIQHLCDRMAVVDVITSGNGIWYFKDRPELAALHEIESFFYARKGTNISIARTFASIGQLLQIQIRNAKRVQAFLEERRPDVVVTDSMYTFGPIKRMGLPFVALNNADVVYRSVRMFKDRPKAIMAQFYGVEMLDFFYHSVVPDLVISPSLDPSLPGTGGKFTRVDPIVRKSYKPFPYREKPAKVVIMLSGSVFGSPVALKRDSYPVRIEVVGRTAPPDGSPSDGIKYHGRIIDTLEVLQDADLAVVNGGFSAVSEMFCMRKPVVVVPVPRHAEQWVNARTIENLGVGLMATEDNYEDVMLNALDRIDDFRRAYRKFSNTMNGAEQAADIVLRLAEKGRG